MRYNYDKKRWLRCDININALEVEKSLPPSSFIVIEWVDGVPIVITPDGEIALIVTEKSWSPSSAKS